jgi:hypothetical protein
MLSGPKLFPISGLSLLEHVAVGGVQEHEVVAAFAAMEQEASSRTARPRYGGGFDVTILLGRLVDPIIVVGSIH